MGGSLLAELTTVILKYLLMERTDTQGGDFGTEKSPGWIPKTTVTSVAVDDAPKRTNVMETRLYTVCSVMLMVTVQLRSTSTAKQKTRSRRVG